MASFPSYRLGAFFRARAGMRWPDRARSRAVDATRSSAFAAACLLASILFVLFAPTRSWSAPSTSELALNAQLSRKITQDQLVRQAAYVLATEVTMDTDGYPLPGLPTTGGGPTGGGYIPSTSAAPKTDGYGVKLGYCAWDNGSVNNHAGYLPGSASMSAITIAVVSPGADNLFQTTCAQLAASLTVAGDDYVVSYSAGQIMAGVQGSTYFGNPVASVAALAALGTTALSEGQVRLVTGTNTFYVYHAATQWTPVQSGYFQATGSGSDIYYSAGNVAIGQSTATHALDVNSTSGGIPIGLSSTGNRTGIALLDSPGGATNAFVSYDKTSKALRLGASAPGSSLQLLTPGGTVTVDPSGVLQAPQGIVGVSAAISGTVFATSLSASSAFVNGYPVWTSNTFDPTSKANVGINIIAGAGLSGGGNLGSDVTLSLALPNSGVAAGTYNKLTVSAAGVVTNGGYLGSPDISTALGYMPVNPSRNVNTGAGLTGGGSLGSDLTLALQGNVMTPGTYVKVSVDTYGRVTGSAPLATVDVTSALGYTPVNPTRQVIAGNGLSGGGSLGSDVTLSLPNSGVTAGTYTKVTVNATGIVTGSSNLGSGDVTTALGYTPVNPTRNVSTGTGLTGGGSLGSDLTLSLQSGVMTPGTYTKVSVDTYGRVTASAALSSTDVTTGLGYTPVNPTRQIIAGSGLSGTGNLGSDVTLSLPNSGVTAGTYTKLTVNATGIVTGAGNLASGDVTTALGYTPVNPTRNVSTGTGLTGGGSLGSDLTLSLQGGVMTPGSYAKVTVDTYGRVTASAALSSADVTTGLGYTPVNPTRKVSTGTGLTGGGALSADLTLSLATSGVTAGTYSNLTVDTYGRVTVAAALAKVDVTKALGYTPVNIVGDTMTGNLTLPTLSFNASANSSSGGGTNGITWWSPNAGAWVDYMALGKATSTGPSGTLTAPSGNLVTSWARRSFIDNSTTGEGWTFEAATGSSTTPAIMAEIRSYDGASYWNGGMETRQSMRATGWMDESYSGNFQGLSLEIGADGRNGGQAYVYSWNPNPKNYAWGPLVLGGTTTSIVIPTSGASNPHSSYGQNLAVFDGAGYNATTNSPAALTVYGSINAANGKLYANGVSISSDIRLKHDVVSLDPDRFLKSFMAVRPVEFDYNNNNEHNYGYIAQELQKFFPTVVTQRPDGYLAVGYTQMISVIHSVVQKHELMIEALQQNKLDGVAGQWTNSSDLNPRFFFEPNGKTVIRGRGNVSVEFHNGADQTVASVYSNGDMALGGQLGLGAQGAVSFTSTGTRIRSDAPGQISVDATGAARAAIRLQYSPQAQAASARIFGMLVGDESGIALADGAGNALLSAHRVAGIGHVGVNGELTIGDANGSVVHLAGNTALRGLVDGTFEVDTAQGLRVYNPLTKQAAVSLNADGSVVASRFQPTQVVVPYTSCTGLQGSLARDDTGQPVVCAQ